MTIRYALEVIDKQRAIELMDGAKKPNRPIVSNHVLMLCNAYKQNLWKVNGECLKINQKDQLIDGRHRLTAVIETGISIETWVAYNVPDHVMETLDTHRPRKAGDILTIHGYANAVQSAGTIKKLVFLAVGNRSFKLSPSEVRILIERHKIADSVTIAGRGKRNGLFSPSILGAVHYIGSVVQNNPEKALQFINVLCNGVPNYKNDPAFVLREYVISRRGDRNLKIDLTRKDILTAYAWESFRQGKTWGAGVKNVPLVPNLEGWTAEYCFGQRLKKSIGSQNIEVRRNIKKREAKSLNGANGKERLPDMPYSSVEV